MTRSRRQHKLHETWGFNCTCSLCAQPADMADASDARIRKIKHLRSQLSIITSPSQAPSSSMDVLMNRELAEAPQMAELLISLVEQERAQSLLLEAHQYAAVAWNSMGDKHAAVKHASLALEMGLVSAGPLDEDVLDMARLFRQPEKHWSYQMAVVAE